MRTGLDLAKNIFEVYGVDEHEQPALRKTLKRSQVMKFFAQLNPCIVGIESCGSAHRWARKLRRFGQEVRMMAPQAIKTITMMRKRFVKPPIDLTCALYR